MKNGLLIWNVVLTLLVGYLLINQFGSKKNFPTQSKTEGGDTIRTNTEFRMAYFEMDSIEANFEMVKDVKMLLSRKENAINNELEGMSKKFQQRYNYFQNQAQAGTMTQAQSEAASQELKTIDDQMKARKQALGQDYEEYSSKKMKDIKLEIENFMKEYNKTRNFSYIVAEEPGLFYFKDSVYNITADVIKGLNERYKNSSKQ